MGTRNGIAASGPSGASNASASRRRNLPVSRDRRPAAWQQGVTFTETATQNDSHRTIRSPNAARTPQGQLRDSDGHRSPLGGVGKSWGVERLSAPRIVINRGRPCRRCDSISPAKARSGARFESQSSVPTFTSDLVSIFVPVSGSLLEPYFRSRLCPQSFALEKFRVSFRV